MSTSAPSSESQNLKKEADMHLFSLEKSRSIRKDANTHLFSPNSPFLWHIRKKGCIFAVISKLANARES
ncbi:hypothetical protein J2736_000178 [Paenibacillus qinlingensis]|uniref:Uncharacterized protein n=1 Tax=Paenibacillus qinlingensis TaxID=1837343 RepID=A0ABU1NNF4_9BACL|nr:hypothetical protein [Paenibacillus qinlingensis]